MTELSDEQKKAILDEIVKLTQPPGAPSDAITADDYAGATGLSVSRARTILRKAVKDDKLELIMIRGKGYWRKRSSPS